MRFGTWIKREYRRAHGHIASGLVLLVLIGVMGPRLLSSMNSTILASAQESARWFMLLAAAFGLLRAAYGVWRHWELEEDPHGRYLQEHG